MNESLLMRLLFIFCGLIATLPLGVGCRIPGISRESQSVTPEDHADFDDTMFDMDFLSPDLPEPVVVEESRPDAGNRVTNEIPDTVARSTIQPGFIMSVRVEVNGRWEIQEGSVRVSEQGVIRLPLLGAVEAEGHTLPSVQGHLTALYAEYYVNPRVEVELSSEGRHGVFPWGRVTVLGRVGKPGEVALPPTRSFSLVGAIQAAGGFASSANERSIRITCPDGETRRVSMRDIGRGENGPEDIILTDGYIIIVPERIF